MRGYFKMSWCRKQNMQQEDKKTLCILLGVCGSVAAIKLPHLINEINNIFPGCLLKIVATENSQRFFNKDDVTVDILTDQHEWNTWKKIGDCVLHIELCKWADVMVISPLDANTLAKIANGLCDNLLSCVVRAWRREKPLLFAPAMNTYMYEHPLTMQHIKLLESFGYHFIPPVEKKLACGDFGVGAMASVEEIVACVKAKIDRIRT
ncbi:phosphopantothenoylcysteine decarboxylase-like [Rhopilema esculentum]|uniref:phosphopantothenoylcysteine decarboxylase-like n=1 Tax=Rhopilema esculentum TaxID=499914 RepID=UPI0031DBD95E